jgi:hypothetical protein
VERVRIADAEFLAIPVAQREVFVSAFRELAAADNPKISGPGWIVDELRQNQRIAPEGLYSLHVGKMFRGAFFRDGETLVFLGFGYRIPEFYDKLERLRQVLRDRVSEQE